MSDWTVPGYCPLLSILTITPAYLLPISGYEPQNTCVLTLTPRSKPEGSSLPRGCGSRLVFNRIKLNSLESGEGLTACKAPSLKCLPCISTPLLVSRWFHSHPSSYKTLCALICPDRPLCPMLGPSHLILDLPNSHHLCNRPYHALSGFSWG